MRKTILSSICDQWKTVPAVVKTNLSGKTVMVVGANIGLGFEAAKHFATMDPQRLILACRSEAKGEAAVAKLETETGYKKAELWLVDLSDFSSVKAFADKFEVDGGRLDILVQNAGIAESVYSATVDGWESTLQVNDLSSALVALRLIPRMSETGEKYSVRPRIVIVASDVHYWTTVKKEVLDTPNIWQKLNSKEYCTASVMQDRYLISKLFNVLFVRAVDARLPSTSTVVVDSVNPGYCYSSLRRSFSGIRAVIDRLMEIALAWTTEQGSRQLVWAAVGGIADQVRGGYVSISAIQEPSDFVISEEGKKVQERAWTELIDILVKVDPKVQVTVDKYLT